MELEKWVRHCCQCWISNDYAVFPALPEQRTVSWKEEKAVTACTYSRSAAAFRAWQQTSKSLLKGWTEQPSDEGLWGLADVEPRKLWRLRAWLSTGVWLQPVCLQGRGGGACGWVTDFRFTTDSSQLMNFLHLLWRTLKCVFTLGLLKPCWAFRRKSWSINKENSLEAEYRIKRQIFKTKQIWAFRDYWKHPQALGFARDCSGWCGLSVFNLYSLLANAGKIWNLCWLFPSGKQGRW